MSEQQSTQEAAQQLPILPLTLTMPSGKTITTEDLINQLSVLNEILGKNACEAAGNRIREPFSYPVSAAIYEIASSAYYALAGTFYAKEIDEAEEKKRPDFI